MKVARMTTSSILNKLRETDQQLLKNGQSLLKREGVATVSFGSLSTNTQHLIQELRNRGVLIE